MKILHAADLHIGRRSSGVPGHPGDRRHSCAAAWNRLVELAIANEVDVVTLSGDVVDRANRFLEAIGPLESGLHRLAKAGVEVVVVSGNHDFDVLPALVDSIGSSAVRLLGRGGRWERTSVGGEGERVILDGWSFPGQSYPESPLASYLPIEAEAPILTLLHGDLDQPRSRYAPFGLGELERHPAAVFLLGHVHGRRASLETTGARFVYPGSPQAMDAAEQGPHGVCLLEVSGGLVNARWIPTSTVRYDRMDVSAEGLGSIEEIDTRVVARMRAALQEVVVDSGPLETVRFRVSVRGTSAFPREVMARLRDLAADLELPVGGVSGSIDSFEFDIQPPYDLDGIAMGLGAPAVVARLLRSSELDPALAAEVRRVVGEIHGSRAFIEIAGGEDDLAELERSAFHELRLAGSVLLDELMRQKGPADG